MPILHVVSVGTTGANCHAFQTQDNDDPYRLRPFWFAYSMISQWIAQRCGKEAHAANSNAKQSFGLCCWSMVHAKASSAPHRSCQCAVQCKHVARLWHAHQASYPRPLRYDRRLRVRLGGWDLWDRPIPDCSSSQQIANIRRYLFFSNYTVHCTANPR